MVGRVEVKLFAWWASTGSVLFLRTLYEFRAREEF